MAAMHLHLTTANSTPFASPRHLEMHSSSSKGAQQQQQQVLIALLQSDHPLLVAALARYRVALQLL
jgi:hypothetical protein